MNQEQMITERVAQVKMNSLICQVKAKTLSFKCFAFP